MEPSCDAFHCRFLRKVDGLVTCDKKLQSGREDMSVSACDRVLKADGFAARRAGKTGGNGQLEVSQADGELVTCDSERKAARMKPL